MGILFQPQRNLSTLNTKSLFALSCFWGGLRKDFQQRQQVRDIEAQFNTAVSELMKLSNAMAGQLEAVSTAVAQEAVRSLLLLLAPFAPHLADELWEQLQGSGSIHQQRWPEVDASALVRDTITVVLQVKGKVRGNLEVPAAISKDELEQVALASDVAQKWLEGNAPKRVIVVPGKLVNLVP